MSDFFESKNLEYCRVALEPNLEGILIGTVTQQASSDANRAVSSSKRDTTSLSGAR